jgi:hypothetical protein
MNNLANKIKQEMSMHDFIKTAYPALVEWGVEDQDVMIHSLGVSCWNTLGYKLGYMSVAECPAPFPDVPGDDIRSDSVWFDKQTRDPLVVVEFERYDGTGKGKKKLYEKTENLFEASERWGRVPHLLILSSWSCGMVSAPDHKKMVKEIRKGFKNRKGAFVPVSTGAQFLFSRFCFQPSQGNKLKLDRIIFED